MHVLACDAPTGALEPAPITSLPLNTALRNSRLSAFWCEDDRYVVLAESGEAAGTNAGHDTRQWYCFDMPAVQGPSQADTEERVAIGKLLADIIPLGGGRVAFPVGSSGRRVYRVWRTGAAAQGGKFKILEVRAARSRRRPA